MLFFIYILKIEKNYTFIPTSLFRDCFLYICVGMFACGMVLIPFFCITSHRKIIQSILLVAEASPRCCPSNNVIIVSFISFTLSQPFCSKMKCHTGVNIYKKTNFIIRVVLQHLKHSVIYVNLLLTQLFSLCQLRFECSI